MLNKIYLIGGVAVLVLYVVIEATGWDLFNPGNSLGGHGGGRGSSGYHGWGFGGGK